MNSSILIVDDMPDNLRLLANILKNSGCAVRLLQDSSSAFSAVLDAPPDLILLDILMPEMGGYEVCQQLKADPRTRDIPVLFLSALTEASDKIKAFAVGGIDYITKPFQAEEVLARVHAHLMICRLHRQLARQNEQLQQEIVERTWTEEALQESQRQLEASYRREQQRRQLSDTLREVAAVVGSSLDTTYVLDAMLTQLRQVVMYHHATVTLVEGEQCTVVAGRDAHGAAVGRFTFPKTHYPLNIEALQAKTPILVPDVQADPRWQPGMSEAVIRSFINAPLLVQDRQIGVLGVGRNDDIPYTDDDAQTVFAFASQVAVALENARLYTTARQELADRQRAETALRKAFQLQEKIFASLDDVILVADPETHEVLLCNPAVERIFGYPEHEMFGESLACLHETQEIFHQVIEDVLSALDAKEVFQIELQMRRKDGSVFLSSQHAAELVDETGERVGILWIIREITEQRRAEQALADERNLLRTLINHIPMLIYVKDPECRFVLANDATIASMGMTAQEDLIGKTDFDFHPADLAAQYAADERALLESGRALVDYEEPVFDPRTQTMRWLLSTKVPFYDSHGRLRGFVGMNHDITDRKQMEEHLRQLQKAVETTDVGITITDLDGRILYCNPADASVHGYAVAELIGQPASIFAVPPGRDLQRGETPDEKDRPIASRWKRERLNRRKDGSTFPVTLISNPIEDQQGALIGRVVVCEDITERKRAETELLAAHHELQEKNAQLAELNASKDKFFSIISHDLRSPLNVMLGYSQLLTENIDRYTTAEMKSALSKIYTSADKLYTLLENLLTWSRLQRGAMHYTPETFLLKTLIEENLDLFQSKADQKQSTLQSTMTQDSAVYADYQMVNTVVRNLVSNALKFTPAGGNITISAAPQETQIEVAIRDTGVGIAPEDLAKLFRIDTQYTQRGTDGETGTGLGLSLCKDLVEKNGGRIWVESVVGEGTIFRFTLPIGARIRV